jgi:hypothetical protein
MSMSVTGVPPAPPRVRHQARQALAVMAFSAATSVGFSLTLVLLMSLGRQG